MSLNGKGAPFTKWQPIVKRHTIEYEVAELASRIDNHYVLVQPVYALCVLKGGFQFYSDLLKELNISVEVEFIFVSSYGDNEVPGKISINASKIGDLSGKHVLIVDDICDTGRTLKSVIEILKEKSPKDIKTCTFLLKENDEEFKPDFYCLKVRKDMFYIGYGMDHKGLARNFPFIVGKPKD